MQGSTRALLVVERRLVVSGEVALLKKVQPLMPFLRLVADRDKTLNQLLLRVGEALRQDVTAFPSP
jgi:hypothetical protein